MSDSSGDVGPVDPLLHPAQAVIQVFGGIRPMAHKLGIAVSTVQGWKERGTIPRSRHPEIQAAAGSAGLSLDPALLAASDQTQAPTIEGVAAPVSEPPTSPTPHTAPAAATTGSWLARQLPGVLLGGLLVAGGFLLAVGTSDLWLQPIAGTPADVEQRLAALEAQPQDDGNLAEISSKVETLRQQIAGLGAGADPAALDSLRQELLAAAATQTKTALDQATQQLRTLQAELDEARKTLADQQARLAALPSGDQVPGWAEDQGAQLAAFSDRILALEATAGTQAGRLGALDSLDQRIADAVSAALAAQPTADAGAPAANSAAALALAAAGLNEAVAAGRPFPSELALARQLTAGDANATTALDALAAQAEAGLPSESQLRASFPATAQAILAAERGAAGGDWLDDLWHSVGGLVSVRPIGEVVGDDAAARVARAEQRLEAGDLAAAVAELKALTGAPAEAAASWLAAAETRLAGLTASQQLLQQALARLAGG